MRKKGFTLVELIAVIVLLGVIGLIMMPVINDSIKESREKMYLAQLDEIKQSTEKWAFNNIDILPKNDGEITVSILQLKQAGLLELDLRDPRTGDLIPNETSITIKKTGNSFEYIVNEIDSSDGMEYNEKSPTLILNGNVLEYVELNSIYEDKGVIAKDVNGNVLSNVNVQYQLDGREVSGINTSNFNTYKITYTVSSNASGQINTSKMIRTVIVRDTTPPDLNIPEDTTISLSKVNVFDIMEGVTTADNSLKEVKVTVSGFDKTVGEKRVTYTATDESGNTVSKIRRITIK